MTTDRVVNGYTIKAGANLRRAYLASTSLSGACLVKSDLREAALQFSDLQRSDLRDARLQRANLTRCNLTDSDLRGASLKNAILRGAILSNASVEDADIDGAVLPDFWVCPQEGDFIGYLRVRDGAVLKVLIPAEAKRISCLTSRICRAEYVKVLEGRGKALYFDKVYEPGMIIRAGSFDSDIRRAQGGGVPFYVTRQEAER